MRFEAVDEVVRERGSAEDDREGDRDEQRRDDEEDDEPEPRSPRLPGSVGLCRRWSHPMCAAAFKGSSHARASAIQGSCPAARWFLRARRSA